MFHPIMLPRNGYTSYLTRSLCKVDNLSRLLTTLILKEFHLGQPNHVEWTYLISDQVALYGGRPNKARHFDSERLRSWASYSIIWFQNLVASQQKETPCDEACYSPKHHGGTSPNLVLWQLQRQCLGESINCIALLHKVPSLHIYANKKPNHCEPRATFL